MFSDEVLNVVLSNPKLAERLASRPDDLTKVKKIFKEIMRFLRTGFIIKIVHCPLTNNEQYLIRYKYYAILYITHE